MSSKTTCSKTAELLFFERICKSVYGMIFALLGGILIGRLRTYQEP